MTGSRKWMVYTMDSGETVAKQVDESNGEALGFDDYTAPANVTATPIEALSLRAMRYVLAVDDVTGKRRKFPVGKPDFTSYVIGGQFTIDGRLYNVSGTVGEKKTFPQPVDTGEIDGDNT